MLFVLSGQPSLPAFPKQGCFHSVSITLGDEPCLYPSSPFNPRAGLTQTYFTLNFFPSNGYDIILFIVHLAQSSIRVINDAVQPGVVITRHQGLSISY